MTRIPLRPLATILDARRKGSDPDVIERRTTSQRLNGMMARDVPEVPILITKAYRLEDDSTPAKQANEEKDAQ